ncbi:nitrate/nitrite transporter [Pseudonocardia spinosispora]|uniref:nitrate/nitrite transporter n=1 Tax=Pseudonocardia spinosispora TaxID=103441 RepID=UPI00041F74F4|nr:nitrate/nitrite transporter [Pseudonocardia spinosispora]
MTQAAKKSGAFEDRSIAPPVRRGRWIDHWTPEDPDFWARTGAKVANRNLWFSIFVEHVGFAVWSLWSVFVLFMGPEYHIDAAGKFFLVSTPTLVGAVLRVPYTFAVARFGGRNFTVVSGLLLLIPTVAAASVLHPGTSYTTFMLVAALAGFGGGNFASSMTNINTLFPEGRKGLALGLNAGGGNLGVAVVQLIGLLIIAVSGAAHPRLMLVVYIPLVVVSALCAALFMDNLSTVRNDTGAAKAAVSDPQTSIMSLLYIGTFGSFIGYSFAFGLVLQSQFGRTPLQATAVTFIGPLLGSLIRPVGGWLSDRVGGTRVTFWNFLLMGMATLVCILASGSKSLALFTIGFIALFVFSGLGNGSTYKMIPAIFRAKALAEIDAGESSETALLRARRISGAAIGIISAVGALGGLLINLAFRQSFAVAKSGVPAFYGFLAFYVLCAAVTYVVYLRKVRTVAEPSGAAMAYASV